MSAAVIGRALVACMCTVWLGLVWLAKLGVTLSPRSKISKARVLQISLTAAEHQPEVHCLIQEQSLQMTDLLAGLRTQTIGAFQKTRAGLANRKAAGQSLDQAAPRLRHAHRSLNLAQEVSVRNQTLAKIHPASIDGAFLAALVDSWHIVISSVLGESWGGWGGKFRLNSSYSVRPDPIFPAPTTRKDERMERQRERERERKKERKQKRKSTIVCWQKHHMRQLRRRWPRWMVAT